MQMTNGNRIYGLLGTHPFQLVLANTALLEAAVGEAELKARQAEQWTQSASLDDTPESVAQSPLIKSEAIQDAVEKLEGVLARGTEEHQEVMTDTFIAYF